MLNNKKTLSVIGAIVLVITVITVTYAFFGPQGDLFKSRDISATSNTTDYLSFQISNDISFRVTQADFAQGNGNKYGETTATAVLTPNNKTGEGTANYYIYLNLTDNGIVYSSTNTNHYPELLLQVFDSNDDLVEIDYFADTVTYGLLEGYDITGVTGLIPILNNHEIVASNNTPETETWRIVITMINLDVDQQDNTNKEINASISIQKDVEIAPTVRIAYNANGGVGSMSSETIDNLNGEVISANTFTRDGYYFYGWNTEPDGTGDTYVDAAELKDVAGTDNLTLYAIWENGPGLYNTRTKTFTPWNELGITVTNGEIEATPYSIKDTLEGILALPNTVTSIGESAFSDCTKLIGITIPNSVTSVGDYSLEYTNIKSLIIPNNVTYIGEGTCLYCESLTNVVISNSITSIEESTFEGCHELESITIPSGVTSIADWAFDYTGIRSLEISSSVTSIGEYTFEECFNLESIVVDSNNPVYDSRNNSNAIIETATNKLLYGSNSTVIPNTVTTIANNAFAGSKINSIEIPSSVTSIGNHAFNWCYNLESIVVDANNPVYDSRNNSNALIETATNKLIKGTINTVIPNTVTYIGDDAFNGLNITSIVIPDSVTLIGVGAFDYTSLTSVTIPGSIKSVFGFDNCKQLTNVVLEEGIEYISTFRNVPITSITIPSTVKTIDIAAFSNTNLTSITIPSGVTSIASLAFTDCPYLESITVDPNNTVYDSRNNSNAIIETATNKLITGCNNTVIPNSVVSIEHSAFNGSGITSLTIPSSITSISDYAIANCKNLESITVDPNNSVYDSRDNCNSIIETATNKIVKSSNNTVIPSTVTTIGYHAFRGSALTSLTLPSSITTIEQYAFQESDIVSIAVPNSVTSIDDSAFQYGMKNLSTIYAQSNEVAARLAAVRLPYSVRVIVDPSKF